MAGGDGHGVTEQQDWGCLSMPLHDMKAGISLILIRDILPNTWLATVWLLCQLDTHPRLEVLQLSARVISVKLGQQPCPGGQ